MFIRPDCVVLSAQTFGLALCPFNRRIIGITACVDKGADVCVHDMKTHRVMVAASLNLGPMWGEKSTLHPSLLTPSKEVRRLLNRRCILNK